MSIYHYTVNDDIYGKILKTHSNLKPEKKTEYAEVYEAVEGLGIFCFTLKLHYIFITIYTKIEKPKDFFFQQS